ncbi:MAG: flagellar motor switch protein FliN [Myxococcales bacterium]|nr:flagellar motor switch protein FliN [Myxococcales bacterium]
MTQDDDMGMEALAASFGGGLAGGGRSLGDVERILDVPLVLHVQLGGRRMRVSELLEVGEGSVVELDKPAGAPLQIFANETLIAHGEAVVVGERYGVRVTDIVAPDERVRRLGQSGGGL